jgi:hypothetical protein
MKIVMRVNIELLEGTYPTTETPNPPYNRSTTRPLIQQRNLLSFELPSPTTNTRTLQSERKKSLKKRRTMGYTNNTQTYNFQEEIPLQEERLTTYQIEVIMDTGATFSMLPGHFHFAWKNLQPCLHTIEGMFQRKQHKRRNTNRRVPCPNNLE